MAIRCASYVFDLVTFLVVLIMIFILASFFRCSVITTAFSKIYDLSTLLLHNYDQTRGFKTCIFPTITTLSKTQNTKLEKLIIHRKADTISHT